MNRIRSAVLDPNQKLHFVGLAGSGMSALAQYRALSGGRVSGSDRAFDQGEQTPDRDVLRALGVEILRQDGTGVPAADLLVRSTAVESEIPDLVRARESGVPCCHRAELLAELLHDSSLAVAGTSGKSTVAAMVFEILLHAGRDPGLITGGRLRSLMSDRLLGNAQFGRGPLVVEADESDGSLVRHFPEAALILNLHRDHMETDQALEQFSRFRQQTRGPVVLSDDENLAELRPGALLFGWSKAADLRATDRTLTRNGSGFSVRDVRFELPVPGAFNAWNGLAAAALCHALGVELEVSAAALSRFGGVQRRFERLGEAGGVEVFDDFAHNPVKLRAALQLAQQRSRRVLALFQPHGFAPTRFQRTDLVKMFQSTLRTEDRLWLAPIFFAGGTVSREISSADLVNDLRSLGAPAQEGGERGTWIREVSELAQDGDTVLILGARDASLPELGRRLLVELGRR